MSQRKAFGIRNPDHRPLDHSGTVDLTCKVISSGLVAKIRFIVSNSISQEVLLPFEALQALYIVHEDFPYAVCRQIGTETMERIKDNLKEEFSDIISNDLPEKPLKTEPKEIVMKEGNVQPLQVTRARPVHLHFQEQAYKLVKDLEKAKIIRPVNYVTEWVSPSMFVPKPNGGVRMVTDYTAINKVIERPIHPFMSATDTIRQIGPKAKFFATLDAVSGYFQVPLSEEAMLLTTFLTPWGKFCYTRGPMGFKATQDWWNQISDIVVIDYQEWCAKIVDDILIWASTFEELIERIRLVLQKCRDNDITISEKKLQIGQEVKFAGYIVSKDGIRPDPEKVICLREFPEPKDVTDLRSFLGLAQQLGNFMPDLSQSTVLMRELLKKDTVYQWTPEIQKEFDDVKEILTSDMIVKPFDPQLETQLLTDASKTKGLGYILMQWENENDENGKQKRRIIQCGSFALTPTQRNYAVIELEFLAMVRAIEKCQFYLLGMNKFTVITDHRPIKGIMDKPISEIHNARLIKWRQRIMQYSLEVSWKPGKTHYAADALSRYPIFSGYDEKDDTYACIRTVQEDPRSEKMAEDADQDYKRIAKMVYDGKAVTEATENDYHQEVLSVWDELSTISTGKGLIVSLGERIFPPKDQRRRIIDQLHSSHQGLNKTTAAAKHAFFWPGLINEIKNKVSTCEECQTYASSQRSEKIQSVIEKLERPMQLISSDIFEWKGKYHLATVDGYSGMLFHSPMRNITSNSVIQALENIFKITGYPERLRSDNGRQFVSSETHDYLTSRGITQETSSPEFPSSNGHAEAAVKSIKRLLKKSKNDEEFETGLAELNRQPRKDLEIPADIFMRRKVRGILLRNINDPNEIVTKSDRKNVSAKDINSHELQKLKLGDYVRVQNPRTKVWEDKAKIIGVMKYDRSYLLEDIEDGKVSRKNRRFLKAMQSTELTGQRENSGLGGPEKRDKICSQQNAQVHQNQREDSPNRNLTPRRSARIAKQNENSV